MSPASKAAKPAAPKCPGCGRALPYAEAVDGATQHKECPNCGARHATQHKECPNCGARLVWSQPFGSIVGGYFRKARARPRWRFA